jgi:D-xylonolactonase
MAFGDWRVLADVACDTGENPLYLPEEDAVVWTDIPAGVLYRYCCADGAFDAIYRGRPVGGFTREADGRLLLFRDAGNIVLWSPEGEQTILDEISAERSSRFNDVIADPLGRVFAGTMPTGSVGGRLYRIDPDGHLTIVAENIGCSNGLGFSMDGATLYFTDSAARTITCFSYDEKTGAATDRRSWVTVPEGEGVPDGLTVDREGTVWSARWDGNRITGYQPDGTVTAVVSLPIAKISSLTFGGPGGDIAYVTTAGGGGRPEQGEFAGSLLQVDLATTGTVEHCSRFGA